MTNDQLTIRRVNNSQHIGEFVLRLIYLLAVHPGRVTSWLRSVAANHMLRGVEDSYHLDGCGADIVLDNSEDNGAAVATARALDLDAVDEGDHVHVELDYRKRSTERRVA